MIEVIEIDHAQLSMAGDFCEVLVYVNSAEKVVEFIEEHISYDELNICHGQRQFIQIKSRTTGYPIKYKGNQQRFESAISVYQPSGNR